MPRVRASSCASPSAASSSRRASKVGDPIHFEVRVRLAALTQPDPGRVSVAALVPRGGLSLYPFNISKINYLTPPRILALYQAIVSMSTVK